MIHEQYCYGAHTDDLTCEEVRELRQSATNDIRYCHYNPRSAYHRFAGENPSPTDSCTYNGCSVTWAEFAEL